MKDFASISRYGYIYLSNNFCKIILFGVVRLIKTKPSSCFSRCHQRAAVAIDLLYSISKLFLRYNHDKLKRQIIKVSLPD